MIKEFGNTGYFVDSNGSIYSKYKGGSKSGVKLKPTLDKYGYCKYGLQVRGEQLTVRGHRVVAQTFIPNPENKPQVNHINGIKTDNRVENLEWVTSKENVEHRDAMGLTARGNRAGNVSISEDMAHAICNMLQDNYRIIDIHKELGVPRYIIGNIYRRVTWTHVSNQYNISYIPQQGISMKTFYWICYKLQDGWKYNQILEAYSGGCYLTYSAIKKIKNRKMRPEFSKDFDF
tara:strand:- start:732 stop:1427 length:696 start_codon:yes stop_codon:yes gene_type:complete